MALSQPNENAIAADQRRYRWRLAMKEKVRDLLRTFEALSPPEQHETATEILRRNALDECPPDAALDELAAELFRRYDIEEDARAAS
jgi:hypothetical protein